MMMRLKVKRIRQLNNFSTVLIPLSTSMKTLSDLTKQACDNFVSRYTSEVDSISLKESELEEDIRSLSQQITRYENLTNNLKSMLPIISKPFHRTNK